MIKSHLENRFFLLNIIFFCLSTKQKVNCHLYSISVKCCSYFLSKCFNLKSTDVIFNTTHPPPPLKKKKKWAHVFVLMESFLLTPISPPYYPVKSGLIKKLQLSSLIIYNIINSSGPSSFTLIFFSS